MSLSQRRYRPGGEDGWPVNSTPAIRMLVIARDTPQGISMPLCWVCGQPVDRRYVEVHHRQWRSRGGRANPANLISLHNQFAGECHIGRAHDNDHDDGQADALIAMWSISRHAPAAACYLPVWHAARGWVVLDDAYEWRPATPDELAGLPDLGALVRQP